MCACRPSLRYDIIPFLGFQLRDHFGTLRTDYGVIAPKLQLMIDTFDVCIIGIDDRYALLPSILDKIDEMRDYPLRTIASQGTCNEVIQYIDYDYGLTTVTAYHVLGISLPIL